MSMPVHSDDPRLTIASARLPSPWPRERFAIPEILKFSEEAGDVILPETD